MFFVDGVISEYEYRKYFTAVFFPNNMLCESWEDMESRLKKKHFLRNGNTFV